MLSPELLKQLELAKISQRTPSFLYYLQKDAIVRAGKFETFPAIQAYLDPTDKIASINMERLLQVPDSSDLLVVFRGPVTEAKYLAGKNDRRVVTLDPDTLVTIVTNIFPTAHTHASRFLELWATFD